jgi:hypothetical protein
VDVNTSVRLTADEETELAGILGPQPVGEALTQIGKAALREYVDMLLGQTAVRSVEAREQRLLLLILEAYAGEVPDEAKVARMFNITTGAARSLIRSVLSRYRLRLSNATRQAAVKVLQACGAETEGFRRVSIGNPVIVEYLNALLAELNGELKRISPEARTGTYFRVPEDSYVALAAELLP